MNITLSDLRNRAWLELGLILHVEVSSKGTGSLKRLCIVCPNLRRFPAIPVHAHEANFRPSERALEASVLNTNVFPVPPGASIKFDRGLSKHDSDLYWFMSFTMVSTINR